MVIQVIELFSIILIKITKNFYRYYTFLKKKIGYKKSLFKFIYFHCTSPNDFNYYYNYNNDFYIQFVQK